MTGRWRPLPDTLSPEVAYLLRELRDLKDRSGLSLAGLAARTYYSKSSWERCLNGTALPPWRPVEELAQLTGEPVKRLQALWKRAEDQWSGRAAAPRPATTDPEPEQTTVAPDPCPRARPRRRKAVLIAVLACAALVLAAALAHFVDVTGTSSQSGPTYTVGCRGAQCTGEDPRGMACALDAGSIAHLRIGPTDLELRTSGQCEAAWARVSHSTVGDQVSVVEQSGQTETVIISDIATTTRYLSTRMISTQYTHVRACLESRTSGQHCTP